MIAAAGSAVAGGTGGNAMQTLPAAYLGEWSADPRLCGSEGDDMDQRLFVSQTSVGYRESRYRIRSVISGRAGYVLTYDPNTDADLVAPRTLRLSADGRTIYTSNRADDRGYRRCPARPGRR